MNGCTMVTLKKLKVCVKDTFFLNVRHEREIFYIENLFNNVNKVSYFLSNSYLVTIFVKHSLQALLAILA